MNSEKEFPKVLANKIQKRGAMDKLISDSAQVEISECVKDILLTYMIDDWQSEPHHQHQDFAKQQYHTIKRYVNCNMDYTGAPPELWLLCLKDVCYLLN